MEYVHVVEEIIKLSTTLWQMHIFNVEYRVLYCLKEYIVVASNKIYDTKSLYINEIKLILNLIAFFRKE